MDVATFTINAIGAARERADERYYEFLRVPALSAGWYELPAGTEDPQEPHSEDELYYVVSGRARLRVGLEDIAVEPGSLVFVAAQVEHRFHDITEALGVLVVFAPAEYSQASAQRTP